MEPQYIFGTVRQSGAMIENLKTKGAEHTDLHGYIETVRQYPSETITDRCRILDKYQTEEDGAGNCYDWYLIDQHYRYVDKTTQVAAETADHDEVIAELTERIVNLEIGG
jgi:hypothetical protein